MHPQTQGEIERYHRSMKNIVKLDNYFSPEQLEDKMKEFIQYYDYERNHESLKNVTPSEVYFRSAEKKFKKRIRAKKENFRSKKKTI